MLSIQERLCGGPGCPVYHIFGGINPNAPRRRRTRRRRPTGRRTTTGRRTVQPTQELVREPVRETEPRRTIPIEALRPRQQYYELPAPRTRPRGATRRRSLSTTSLPPVETFDVPQGRRPRGEEARRQISRGIEGLRTSRERRRARRIQETGRARTPQELEALRGERSAQTSDLPPIPQVPGGGQSGSRCRTRKCMRRARARAGRRFQQAQRGRPPMGAPGGGVTQARQEDPFRFARIQQYTPEQQQMLNAIEGIISGQGREAIPGEVPELTQARAGILGRLAQPQPFAPYEEAAQRRFTEETIPTLANRFAQMGPGAEQSGAFTQALGEAGTGLQQDLALARAQYDIGAAQMKEQQLFNLLNIGMSPREHVAFAPVFGREGQFPAGINPLVGQRGSAWPMVAGGIGGGLAGAGSGVLMGGQIGALGGPIGATGGAAIGGISGLIMGLLQGQRQRRQVF